MQLRKMTENEFQSYLTYTYVKYADEQVKAGFWPADCAIELAKSEITDLLPDGLATKNHFLYSLVVTGEPAPVGVLWIMIRERNGRREAFIDDIDIFDRYRRKGYASQALRALEDIVREMGICTIRLHVFSHNHSALDLYKKSGYDLVNIYMEKQI